MTRIVTGLPNTELPVAVGNFDNTRKTIDRVIIHTMVGSWQAAAARFNNPAETVSAHYGVKLDGGLIHWLEETFTAYHAGNYAMNQRSIGIEHEDGGDYNGVRPDVLYTESAKLVKDICTFYNIPIDRTHILKHSEVIATGCPDALDIDRIVREASGSVSPQVDTQAIIDELRKARDDNWTLYQGELTKNNDLNKQFTDLQTQTQDLRDAFDKQTQADSTTGQQLLDVSHERDTIKDILTTIAKQLNVPLSTPISPINGVVLQKSIADLQDPHTEVANQVIKNIIPLADSAITKKPIPLTLIDRIKIFLGL